MVKLNLRGNVELRALVDYVGKRLNISFVYDDEIAGTFGDLHILAIVAPE